jgi:hypothetical protein
VTAEDVEREEAKQAQQLQQHINSAVASAVQKVLEQLASATAEPTGTGYYNFLRAGFSRHRDPEPAGSGRR